MNNLKNPIILTLGVIVVILLMKECSSPVTNILGKPEVISTKSDTTYLPGKDSVYVDTVYKWKTRYIENIQPDSNRIDLTDTSVLFDSYYYPLKDSSLKGTIEVVSEEQPIMVNFEYSVLEKEINTSTSRVDTLKIETTQKVRVNQIYVGGSAVVYPGFNAIFVEADFISKKGWGIKGGVGVVDNTPAISVGFKRLISFRKK